MASAGRTPLYDEAMVRYTFRLPLRALGALKDLAAARGVEPSQVVRVAVLRVVEDWLEDDLQMPQK